jgi:hypothetical protein
MDSHGRVIGLSQSPLTTHTYNRQTSMPPAGFEPTISAGDRPQNYALNHAATGTGFELIQYTNLREPRSERYVR